MMIKQFRNFTTNKKYMVKLIQGSHLYELLDKGLSMTPVLITQVKYDVTRLLPLNNHITHNIIFSHLVTE